MNSVDFIKEEIDDDECESKLNGNYMSSETKLYEENHLVIKKEQELHPEELMRVNKTDKVILFLLVVLLI